MADLPTYSLGGRHFYRSTSTQNFQNNHRNCFENLGTLSNTQNVRPSQPDKFAWAQAGHILGTERARD